MSKLLFALFLFSAVAAPAAALTPAAEKERAAISARWEESAKRDPARFTQVRDVIDGYADRVLPTQRREAPEDGRWGGTSEWRFRETGENCLALAVAATLPGSKHFASPAIVQSVTRGLDFLAATISPEGRWHDSDTNVDRFCLAPAAEALLLLADRLPQERMESWLTMVRRAGEYQYKTYYPRTGSFGSGHYPNMDAYFALSISLAGTLCERPEWLKAAAEVVRRCGENCLLPGGAYEYVDGWNPVPVYQDIMPILLGRYYLLTGDPEAKRQLAATVEYYPQYSEVSGACDNAITPFIKHYWGYNGHAAAPEFTAWLTGDGRNRAVADRRLNWTGGGYWTSLMPQWISGARPVPLPADFLVKNGDIQGFQMRAGGNFTAWLTGRATAHDTIVSAIASDPKAVPLQTQALAGILTEVTGLPEVAPVGLTARFSFYRKPDAPGADKEIRVEAQPSADWQPLEAELTVPEGMANLRLDLFMFFKPGTVVWDDVELLDPEGHNLLPNPGFEQLDAQGQPVGWGKGTWGTDGVVKVVPGAEGKGHAVLCQAPAQADRASWSATIPVPPGQKLRFRARTRTEGIDAARPAMPLISYVTDMRPQVEQVFTPRVAMQRLESGLHAMGNGVAYPTPVDGSWRWGCWNGGSPESAPWRVAQSWILAGGRLYGMLTLRCTGESNGSGVRFRPVFSPNVMPQMRRVGSAVAMEVPRLSLLAWPGAGLNATSEMRRDTLRLDLPDGEYEVDLLAGDPDFPLLPMEVRAGGRKIAGLKAEKGKFAAAHARVTARNGKLELEFVPASGDHWKLAALTVRDAAGKEVRRFDAGPAGTPPAEGYVRLDGAPYSEKRGFGWSRDLSRQERERLGGEGARRTLLSVPPQEDSVVAFAGKPGPWHAGETYTLDVVVAPGKAPQAGKDWGFTGPLAPGVRGWWQRDGKALLLALVNDGEKAFAGELSLSAAGNFSRVTALAGAAPVLTGKSLRGVRLNAGGIALLRVE